jgi:HSP90 family molecular chaperone
MKFHAEIYQLLGLIINAFYGKRIFYENLFQTSRMHVIKLDINHLKMHRYFGEQKELKIDILLDKEIGMTRVQLILNLGTIARSQTRQFMKLIEE